MSDDGEFAAQAVLAPEPTAASRARAFIRDILGTWGLPGARSLPDPRGFGKDHHSERGRGLTLPAALASSWGVTCTATAKAVWFRLPLSPDPASGPEPAPVSGPAAGVAVPDALTAPPSAMLLSGGVLVIRATG